MIERRVCTECGEEKALTAFPFVGRGWVKRGTKERYHVCRTCHRRGIAAEARAKAPKKQKPKTHADYLRENITSNRDGGGA